MPFSIIALQSGLTRISLEGTLDVSTIEGLRRELQAVARRSPASVEIEATHLRSLSPGGVPVLLSFIESIARSGCRVTIKGLPDRAHDTFRSALASVTCDPAPLVN